MLLQMTQMGAIRAATNATNSSAGSSSVNFNAALVKLVNNPSITLNGNTLWSSVSANIGGSDGYADQTATFNPPSLSSNNVVEAWSNTLTWTQSGSASPQNYGGIVVTDPASASVLFAAPFDVPSIPFQNSLSRLELVIRYNPANPNASIVQVLN